MYKLHPCRPSDWAKNFNFSVTAIYLQQKHLHSSVIIVCYTDEFTLNTSRISGTNNLNNVIQYKNFSYKLNTSQFFFAQIFHTLLIASGYFTSYCGNRPACIKNEWHLAIFSCSSQYDEWVMIYVKLKQQSSDRGEKPETPIPYLLFCPGIFTLVILDQYIQYLSSLIS